MYDRVSADELSDPACTTWCKPEAILLSSSRGPTLGAEANTFVVAPRLWYGKRILLGSPLRHRLEIAMKLRDKHIIPLHILVGHFERCELESPNDVRDRHIQFHVRKTVRPQAPVSRFQQEVKSF